MATTAAAADLTAAAKPPPVLAFAAYGTPAPQGSKRAYLAGGRPVIVEANRQSRPWRQVLASEARLAATEAGIDRLTGPLALSVVFLLPRPKSVKRLVPSVRPDLDKLCRCLLDALGRDAGVIADDAQIVTLTAAKGYPTGDERPGAFVALSRWGDTPGLLDTDAAGPT